MNQIDTRTTWTEILIDYLSRIQENQITLVTVSSFLSEDYHFQEKRTNYYYLKTDRRARRLKAFLPDVFRIRKIIEQVNPDIIHAHGAEDCYALAALFSKIPALVSIQAALGEFVRFYPWYSSVRLAPLLSNIALRYAKFIHVNSPYIENYYRKEIKKATIFRLDMPVHKIFFEVDNSPIDNILTCVGSSMTIKGADTLIKVAGLLRNDFPRLKVNIIGYKSPAVSERLQKLALEHKVEKYIDLIGPLGPHDIAKILSKTKVLVVPTRCDIYGVSLAESLCAGVPVVSSNIMGIPYVVDNNSDGFLLHPDDVKGFAEKTSLLLLDENLRRKMGMNGREKARRRWQPEMLLHQYLTAYNTILELSR